MRNKKRSSIDWSENLFRFAFSGPTLFVVGFAGGIAYEQNFPGFFRQLYVVLTMLVG